MYIFNIQLNMTSYRPCRTSARSMPGSMWPQLWMLTVALRCGRVGMDSTFLRRAEIVRKRARKLNWAQPLGLSKVLCLLVPGSLVGPQMILLHSDK